MLGRSVSLLLTLGLLASAPTAAQAASPLLGQWPLDASYETGANQATADISGNALDLRTPVGAMHLGPPARFGTGATLPTNLTPMQVTSPVLAPAQVTLMAWVKQTGNPGTLRYLAGRGDDGLTCGGSTYAIYTGYPAKPGLRFYVRGGAAGASALTDAPADAAVFDGQWHLVAGTYDGTAARLYVDGALVGAPVPGPGALKYSLGGGSTFYVDGYAVEGCSLFLNADDWPGAIDEVRVYDRALTASELGRLATSTGPNAPELVTDASLVPPSTPPPASPATAEIAAAGASVTTASAPAATAVAKAIEAAALKKAASGVAGASKKAPSDAAEVALTAAEGGALAALKRAAASSEVAKPKPARELSAQEAKKTKPDPKVQARLEAMRFGVASAVPAGAQGEVIAAVATIALEKKAAGKVTTQTIVLPPTIGIAGATGSAPVQFPVDAKASAAMGKDDIAKAAMSVQAVSLGDVAGLSLQAQQLQMLMDARTKAASTLSNVLQKVAETQQAIAQNLRGGVDDSERKDQHELEAKQAKLEKQAKALEQQRDEANQKASAAMAQATAAVVNGIVSGTLQAASGATGAAVPAATIALSGCSRCELAAKASR